MAIHPRRKEPPKDELNPANAMPSPYSPSSISSPPRQGQTPLSIKVDMRSPTASIHSNSHSEGLPPIQLNSPRYETKNQTLPSIRSQFATRQQLRCGGRTAMLTSRLPRLFNCCSAVPPVLALLSWITPSARG
ncbi:uncharacterized protein B0I36DRAFT_395801 [Microdochium trichocladiopsis]|uniref:Uncharacterized protein n=1 Tax=Microdochium trichocladiopsis TaxID=1682393 RepID=A0A9P8XVU3_9PEZI|nr:uncharacterized protein B0I36DRAFT_395801 [Microdochium trichocladiopsis]KAH7016055.1 hypothetical protein B0I36DRAFT_395801 [Microdochium trichocladiopsis]